MRVCVWNKKHNTAGHFNLLYGQINLCPVVVVVALLLFFFSSRSLGAHRKQEISVVIFHAITMIFSFFSYFVFWVLSCVRLFLFSFSFLPFFYCCSYYFVIMFLFSFVVSFSHVPCKHASMCMLLSMCVSYLLHLHLFILNYYLITRRKSKQQKQNKIKLKTTQILERNETLLALSSLCLCSFSFSRVLE